MSNQPKIVVRWRRDRYICLSLPFKGWSYYVDLMWCDFSQGRKPWVAEVHPKCADIKGWRFGWKRISICWGREKLYSPNAQADAQPPSQP
jgi:hypothetical protein